MAILLLALESEYVFSTQHIQTRRLAEVPVHGVSLA
jgi:hypothetical protein